MEAVAKKATTASCAFKTSLDIFYRKRTVWGARRKGVKVSEEGPWDAVSGNRNVLWASQPSLRTVCRAVCCDLCPNAT